MSDIIHGLTSQSFSYDGRALRTSLTESGDPLFMAADACGMLGLSNVSQALKTLDDDEVVVNTLITDEGIPGNPNVNWVTESGLYGLILASRKPQAKAFRRWIKHDVLPAIRKQGFYAANGVDPQLARIEQGRLLLERARAKLREAAELRRQAAILLTLGDGVSVADIIAEQEADGVTFGPQSRAAAVRTALRFARRNNIPIGRDAKGRMTLPRAAMEKALDLDQRWLDLS